MWEWIRCVLTNPTALAEGLNAYKSRQDKEHEPIRERLAAMGDLLDNNRQQLERLLDLYLSGDLAKEMLIDRKSHLETKIARLEKEQADLVAHLQAQTLTEMQIQSIQEFAAKVAQGLETAENSFEIQRRIVEALDLQVTLAVEDGQEVVYLQCVVGEGTCIPSDGTDASRCSTREDHSLVARIMLEKPVTGKLVYMGCGQRSEQESGFEFEIPPRLTRPERKACVARG